MYPCHGSRAPTAAPPAPAPTEASTLPRPDEDARALYTALHRGLSTLGPDEAVIFGVLAERSTEHLAEVARVYATSFGEELEKRLKKDLSPADWRRVQALFEGDRVQRLVERLRQATSGLFGRNARALVTAIESVPPKLLDDVTQRFASYFGPLELAVRRSVTGPVREGVLALLRGDRSAAVAFLGADFAAAF